MGKCLKGIYQANYIVTHAPLVCWGGVGQPACEHLKQCAGENNIIVPDEKKGAKEVETIPGSSVKIYRVL